MGCNKDEYLSLERDVIRNQAINITESHFLISQENTPNRRSTKYQNKHMHTHPTKPISAILFKFKATVAFSPLLPIKKSPSLLYE